jgi:alpha-tubulin suppressor-like RCC1 family protein
MSFTACCNPPALLDLPLEMLTAVCQQLDLHDLVRVAETCKRLRLGDGGLETVELPTKSPVVTALCKHAFSRPKLVPSTRPMGCSESWVAYLARCGRQRRFREAPPIVAGHMCSLFADAAGRLLACGNLGHDNEDRAMSASAPVAALAGVRVRNVAATYNHSFAVSWDGRIYSWGGNYHGQLGHGDTLDRASPALLEGFEDVRCAAASQFRSLAVTQSEDVFSWGAALQSEAEDELRPIIVEGFGGVRVRRVCAGSYAGWRQFFAIGEKGELCSWGGAVYGLLGHGDTQDLPSPKRVEALRGVRVSSIAVGNKHVLALAEDGLVYAWGGNYWCSAVLGNPDVQSELLPKPVEALRGVRVGSIAAGGHCSYAVTDTGELWAWGCEGVGGVPLGDGKHVDCPLPKPISVVAGHQGGCGGRR